MKSKVKVFSEIGELLTLEGAAQKGGCRIQESDLGIISDAVVVCSEGKIGWAGAKSKFKASDWPGAELVSLHGQTVMPAFVNRTLIWCSRVIARRNLNGAFKGKAIKKFPPKVAAFASL